MFCFKSNLVFSKREMNQGENLDAMSVKVVENNNNYKIMAQIFTTAYKHKL